MAKKEFSSAADAFLNTPLSQVENKKESAKKTETKPIRSTSNKELKNRSVLIKITPSLYEQVKAMADDSGLSVNSFVTTLLIKAVKSNE